MSGVNPDVDLGAFARGTPGLRRPRRRWVVVLLPIVLLLGFAGVLLSTLTDFTRTAASVTLTRPIALDADAAGAARDTVLFQAAGWAEPDPYPVWVTPLAPGVIEALLVQPSDRVAAGDVIARLVARDAELALDRAQAEVQQAEAEHALARAELDAARAAFDAALELTENLAVAEADAAGRAAEREHRRAAVSKGVAQIAIAEQELALQQFLVTNHADGPRAIELAQARLAEARADLDILQADAALADADADQAAARRERMRGERDLRIAEHLRIASATALVAAAEARRATALARREEAALALSRMTITAPCAGVVLAVLAAPGSPVGPTGDTMPPICSLYDPGRLRVRVDVPQEQVGLAGVGLLASITSQSRREPPYRGEVTRVVQQADVNKVTLQIHVRVLDPDAALRPEMLCTVTVLGRAEPTPGDDGATATQAVRIPARLIDGDQVWVVDGVSGRATRRSIEVAARDGDTAIVRQGLNVSDKLIDEGRAALREGARIHVRGGP